MLEHSTPPKPIEHPQRMLVSVERIRGRQTCVAGQSTPSQTFPFMSHFAPMNSLSHRQIAPASVSAHLKEFSHSLQDDTPVSKSSSSMALSDIVDSPPISLIAVTVTGGFLDVVVDVVDVASGVGFLVRNVTWTSLAWDSQSSTVSQKFPVVSSGQSQTKPASFESENSNFQGVSGRPGIPPTGLHTPLL